MSRVRCVRSLPFIAPDFSSRRFLYEAGKEYDIPDPRVLDKLIRPQIQVRNRMVSCFELIDEGGEATPEEEKAPELNLEPAAETKAKAEPKAEKASKKDEPKPGAEEASEKDKEDAGDDEEAPATEPPWALPEGFDASKWPKHAGGGNYDLPNGDRVKGKFEAQAKLDELLKPHSN